MKSTELKSKYTKFEYLHFGQGNKVNFVAVTVILKEMVNRKKLNNRVIKNEGILM